MAPGGRTASQRVANDDASSRVADDPGEGGQWSAVLNTPVVPVFQAVLPNGKVLLWDSVGDQSAPRLSQPYVHPCRGVGSQHGHVQAGESRGYNIFCAGYSAAGGRARARCRGQQEPDVRRDRANPYVRLAHRDLVARAEHGRGPLVSVSGRTRQRGGLDCRRGPRDGRDLPEQPTLRRLTGFTSYANRDHYPFLVPRPTARSSWSVPTTGWRPCARPARVR